MSLNLSLSSLYTHTDAILCIENIQIEIDLTYIVPYQVIRNAKKRFNFPRILYCCRVYISLVQTTSFYIHTSLYCSHPRRKRVITKLNSSSSHIILYNYYTLSLLYMVMPLYGTFFLNSICCVFILFFKIAILASWPRLLFNVHVYPIFTLDPHRATQHYTCVYCLPTA